MSHFWVRFCDRDVPNRWNPALVGRRFNPKSKPRRFGSVPILRCVSSRKGLKCLRQNALNKRWYSLSPARPSGAHNASKVPRFRNLNLEVSGWKSNLNNVGIFCQEECVGQAVPGMRVPKGCDKHILHHMRCNCSACMNFACLWRNALKNEFKRQVIGPVSPKRKPQRWMPVIGRCLSPKRARVFDKGQSVFNNRLAYGSRGCQRSPHISWWFGDCVPTTDYKDNVAKKDVRYAENRMRNDCSPRSRQQQPDSPPCSDGFTDVAMDGTIRRSRLRDRARKLTFNDPLCEGVVTRCPARASSSPNRQLPTDRGRLVQGIMTDAKTICRPQIDKLDNLSYCTPTTYTSTKKCPNKSQFNKTYKCQHDSRRSEYYYVPQINNRYCSNKTENKYSSSNDRCQHDRHNYRSVLADKHMRNDDSFTDYEDSRELLLPSNKENDCDSMYHHPHYNEEDSMKLSLPNSHISKNTLIKNSNGFNQPTLYNEKLCEKHSFEDILKSRVGHQNCEQSSSKFSSTNDSTSSSSFTGRVEQVRNSESCKDLLCSHRQHDHYQHDHGYHRHLCEENLHGSSYENDFVNEDTQEINTKHRKRNSMHSLTGDDDNPNSLQDGIDHIVTLNRNIDDRLPDEDTFKTHLLNDSENKANKPHLTPTTIKKHKESGHHEEKCKDTSIKLKGEDKNRLPSKIYSRWTSLSPDKFQDDSYHLLCDRPIDNCMEFNDNRKIKRNKSPEIKYLGSRYLSRNHTRMYDNNQLLDSEMKFRRQKNVGSKRSLYSSETSSIGESMLTNNHIYYPELRVRSPTDPCCLLATRRSRKFSSGSRTGECVGNESTCNFINTSDQMQSNSLHFRDSEKYSQGGPSFRPSERAIKDSRPRNGPDWLNKHLSLMTECNQERQKNAKSRMKRIVDKTRALSRSTEHMHIDLGDMHQRLDKVKDTQQRYFERVNEAIQRLQNRNNACNHSQTELNTCVRGMNHLEKANMDLYDNSTSKSCLNEDRCGDHTLHMRDLEDTARHQNRPDETDTDVLLRRDLCLGGKLVSCLDQRLRQSGKCSHHARSDTSHTSDLRSDATYTLDPRGGLSCKSDFRSNTPYTSDSISNIPFTSDSISNTRYMSDHRSGTSYTSDLRSGSKSHVDNDGMYSIPQESVRRRLGSR